MHFQDSASFPSPGTGSRPARGSTSADLHSLRSQQVDPGLCVQIRPPPRRPLAPRAPAPLRDPGAQSPPVPLTVATSHEPPALKGPARTPAHAHQGAHEVVAT